MAECFPPFLSQIKQNDQKMQRDDRLAPYTFFVILRALPEESVNYLTSMNRSFAPLRMTR